MANLADGVALTELGVITRWSLAVRQPEVERNELIEELRADLAWLEAGRPRRSVPAPVDAAPAKVAPRREPVSEAKPAVSRTPLKASPSKVAAARANAAKAAASGRTPPPS